MKKLIFLIILVLLIGCGSSHEKVESVSTTEYIEASSMMKEFESSDVYIEYAKTKDSVIKEIAERGSIKEDSVAKKSTQRQKLEISAIDTTSVIQSLRKNKEVINQQQILLDSLLKEKKKN